MPSFAWHGDSRIGARDSTAVEALDNQRAPRPGERRCQAGGVAPRAGSAARLRLTGGAAQEAAAHRKRRRRWLRRGDRGWVRPRAPPENERRRRAREAADFLLSLPPSAARSAALGRGAVGAALVVSVLVPVVVLVVGLAGACARCEARRARPPRRGDGDRFMRLARARALPGGDRPRRRRARLTLYRCPLQRSSAAGRAGGGTSAPRSRRAGPRGTEPQRSGAGKRRTRAA